MDPVSCRTPDRFPRQARACVSGGVEDKYGKIINEIIVRTGRFEWDRQASVPYISDKEEHEMPETIIRPYEEKMVSSALLEIPRNTYQRGLNPERVKRISHSFDERIANEPKVSLRNGHYVVFDGQHIVAAMVDHNSGEELPIRCKVYSDLTEQDEAKLFANQAGFGVPPSIGTKLRALVFAGDPEAVSFLKANEEIGLKVDYGQHKGRYRIACIAAALSEFRKLGPEKYQMAMKMILDGWDGDPDSLRAETVTGVCRFVDLYRGEFDPKRAVKRFRTVDPLKIYRDGKAMGDNLPGYKKYLYQVLLIYNGASKKAALPMKF